MNELKIIENELVPVFTTSTGEKVVYGTELYEILGSKQEYSNWIKNRLKECDGTENEDFTIILSKSTGGRPKTEYIIKLDTAKEMAMLERNEKGKQVRRYFIQVEKKYKDASLVTQELSPQLQFLINVELEQKRQAEKLEEVDRKVDSIKEVIALRPNVWRKDTGAIINKIAYSLGGPEHIRVVREESYKILEERMHVSLSIRLTNKKKNYAMNQVSKSKIDKLNQLDVIADDPKLIEGYIAIVKEMAVKYGVSLRGGE